MPVKAKKPKKGTRQIVHSHVKVVLCADNLSLEGATFEKREPLLSQDMKTILGWEEQEEGGEEFGDLFNKDVSSIFSKLGKDRKIRLTNNLHNRPVKLSHLKMLTQEVAMRRTRLNGESIVIGKTDACLSVQHRALAVILATEMWELGKGFDGSECPWKETWATPPSWSSVVTYGISEDADVTRTLDTGSSRTLYDAMIAEGNMFTRRSDGSLTPMADRIRLCKMADYASRELWARTGSGLDAWAPERSHSEALEWMKNHPHLEEAVLQIDGQTSPAEYVSPAYAVAYLYLMAASESDGDAYRDMEVRSEKKLDFDRWDEACKFWSNLVGNAPEFKAIKYAYRPFPSCVDYAKAHRGMPEENDRYFTKGTGRGRHAERVAVLTNAWNAWLAEKPFKNSDLAPEYSLPDEETGAQTMEGVPVIGRTDKDGKLIGIDVGDAKEFTNRKAQAAKDAKAAEIKEDGLEATRDDARKAKGSLKGKLGATPPVEENGEDEENLPRVPVKPTGKGKQPVRPAPGEVKDDGTSATVAKAGVNGGLPPPLKLKPQSRKEIQAEQTRKAREADEELAREAAEDDPIMEEEGEEEEVLAGFEDEME